MSGGALEQGTNAVVRGAVDLRPELLGAPDELAHRAFFQRGKELFAPLQDEASKALHRPSGGVSALLLFVNDLSERDFGEVRFGAVVDDLDFLAAANELGDAIERDVFAVARVVQLSVRVALDDPNLSRLSHGDHEATPATHRVKLALWGTLVRLARRGTETVDRATPFGALIQRLARLDEIDMRAALICERFESLSDEDAVQLLEEAHRRASLGGTDAQSVFLALGWALFEPRLAPRRPELGTAARRAELHHVADFVTPPLEDGEPAEDKRGVPDFGRGRPLTLGERKSLARTHDRSLIQRVVRDPHPDVVRILLDNPSLTEEDVVRVCAARPNHPTVLQTVYRHRRWVVRYRPRNAIVRNPNTPLDIALLLAPLLHKGELKEAATSSELASPLRLSCKTILEMRTAP